MYEDSLTAPYLTYFVHWLDLILADSGAGAFVVEGTSHEVLTLHTVPAGEATTQESTSNT